MTQDLLKKTAKITLPILLNLALANCGETHKQVNAGKPPEPPKQTLEATLKQEQQVQEPESEGFVDYLSDTFHGMTEDGKYIEDENKKICMYAQYDYMPWINEPIREWNNTTGRKIIEGINYGYTKTVPWDFRLVISNGLENLGQISSFGGNIMEGEFLQALCNAWHFVVDSTLGVLGGGKAHKEFGWEDCRKSSIGKGLESWGVPIFYVELPFAGPTTLAEIIGDGAMSVAGIPGQFNTTGKTTYYATKTLKETENYVTLREENKGGDFGSDFITGIYFQNRINGNQENTPN